MITPPELGPEPALNHQSMDHDNRLPGSPSDLAYLIILPLTPERIKIDLFTPAI